MIFNEGVDADLSTNLYRYGVALAIGALIGFERQSRLETPPETEPSSQPDPPQSADPPSPTERTTESLIRAAVAAGESSRYGSVDSGPRETATPPAPPRRGGRAWVPDFQQAVGVRTFMLLALAGAMAASLSTDSPWVFAIAFMVVGGLVAASYMGSIRAQGDLGLTSEISALTVFLLGGMCAKGMVELAGATAVVITMTLALKQGLHHLAKKIRQEDIQAVLKFAVLTLIILPILPKTPINVGKFLPAGDVAAVASADIAGVGTTNVATSLEDVAPVASAGLAAASDPLGLSGEALTGPWWRSLSFSPRKIWYMVILISGISFAGYILGKVVSTSRGLVLTGIVGGLVSSTAVSLSYAQKSNETPELSRQFAIGILLANAIMPARLLLVVVVIAPVLLAPLAIPLLAMMLVAILTAVVLHLKHKEAPVAVGEVQHKNPFEIIPALKFGLLFGLVLFVAEVARGLFGADILYLVAVLAGLTDVDPISLSVANFVSDGSTVAKEGAIMITLAAVSNTLVKGGFVATMGSKQLRGITLAAFGLMFLAAAGGIAWMWFAL